MSKIRPFKAYRPKPELAAKVASVPYDVINTKEAIILAEGNPYSFLHVGRPEIDLDSKIDIHDDKVYEKGAENLRKFIRDGVLVREKTPALYIYQQTMSKHVQAGLVCTCPAKEYEEGLIKIHELTRKDKEDDRTRHVSTQNAHAEPVFLTYRSKKEIDAIINKVRKDKPAYDFKSPDGIGHAVWVISDQGEIEKLQSLFNGIDALYVADGHHRTAAAVRNAQAARKNYKNPTGNEPSEWFMAVLFPHDQLQILGYHRLVVDLNGHSTKDFIAKIKDKFEVAPTNDPNPKTQGTFGMLLEGKWYQLKAKPGTYPKDDPIRSLDVSILQENLLAPLLGIKDPRTDKRIDFVGGIRGTPELEKRCNEGMAIAFSLAPVSIYQLLAVADAKQIMPPKSTWFEPKLRSGLTVRIIED
jgi:uncharacterized protein (DUF1015 family)